MSFEFGRVFKEIEKNKNVADISQFMGVVIDLCQSLEPSESWELFRALPYRAESIELSGHVLSVLEREPARLEGKGFWFGINNPVLDSGEATAGIYFSVSSSYDPADEDIEWACEAEHYPDGAEFQSPVFQELYRLAYSETGLKNKAEYPLCLAYGVGLAQIAMAAYKVKHQNKKFGYAVGFDSGDFINFGWV